MATRREPARGGPSRGGPSKGGPSRGGPSRGGPSKGGPSKGGPSKGGPSRGGPSRKEPAKGGPSRGGPSRKEPAKGGPSRGGPSRGGPSRGPSRGGELEESVMEILRPWENFGDKVGDWKIIDVDSGLALLDYFVEMNDKNYDRRLEHLHGAIVDLNNKKVVTFSTYPYGKKLDAVWSYLPDNLVYKPAYEGVTLRVYLIDGKVHISSFTKLDVSASTFGSSPRFTDLFKRVIPEPMDLFKDEKDDTFYVFTLIHPSLLVASKMGLVNDGVTILSLEQVYSTNEGLPSILVEKFVEEDKVLTTGGVIDNREMLTYDEADYYFKYGWYDFLDLKPYLQDPRLVPGEAVYAYTEEEGMYMGKFISVPCAWRRKMNSKAGGNSTIWSNFFELVQEAVKVKGKGDVLRRNIEDLIPLVTPVSDLPDEKELRSFVITGVPLENFSLIEKSNYRIQMWHMAYLISAPIYRYEEVVNVLAKYKAKRTEVINWLENLYDNMEVIRKGETKEGRWEDSDTLGEILRSMSRKRVSEEAMSGLVKKSGFTAATMHVLRNTYKCLNKKEPGPSTAVEETPGPRTAKKKKLDLCAATRAMYHIAADTALTPSNLINAQIYRMENQSDLRKIMNDMDSHKGRWDLHGHLLPA